MGIMKKTICPKCGKEYSALRSDCPYCGARTSNQSARTPRSSDAVRNGTAASARAAANTKWQLLIGLCLIAAVIIAVIVLITTTLNGDYDEPAAPTPSVEVTPSAAPTPTATPTPTPTVESLTITFLGEEKKEFSAKVGSTTQLAASVYPLELEGPIEWSSTDESVLTVDSTGLVTAVKKGDASVIARCFGKAAECRVVIW